MPDPATDLRGLLSEEATRQRAQRVPPYDLLVARARTRRRTRGAVLIAAATVVAVAFIAGPRIFTGSPDPVTVPPAAGASSGLQLRPVLEVSTAPPAGCPTPDPSPSPDLPVTACTSDGLQQFQLGPAVIGVADIQKVAIEPAVEGGDLFGVDVTLDTAGAASLAGLTRSLVDNPPPTNQMAVLINGVVNSAPLVESTITDGLVQVSGGSKAQARVVAAQIEGR